MLENIEDDLRAERLNDQGPHRKVEEVRADLGRTFRAPILLDVGAVEIKVTLHKKCQNIQAIKDANNGKVPKDYEGAYQKTMKKASKVKIKAVTSRPAEAAARGSSPSLELVETYLWPMISAPAPPRMPRYPLTATMAI